jgi:DNA transposition AAA+ family ATPase
MSAERIVAKMALFDQIYLPYPPHIAFHNECKYLLELGIATRGRPQKGMRALAPSGSGKTSAALSFIRQYQAKNPRTQTSVPIVYVALERAATAKKLMISILEYFGDSYAAHGNEQALKKRVIACFQRFGTLLLIIDEAQHLNYRVYEKNDVTDSLKRLLDEGVVPIVFIGTKDAEDLFTRNVQLSSRLISPCDFEPLDLTVQADRSLLSGYVTLLDQALVEKRILPNSSGLADPEILTRLFLVADGVIGRVSRLLTVALEIALRRGAEKIEWQDLALAVDRWAIPNGLTGDNPFLQEDAL